jgi:carnosine N-methyltransferase
MMAASASDSKGDCNLESEAEKEHFQRVCTAFSYYRTFAMRRVARAHENFSCLPLHHQQLLNDFLPNLDRLKAAIDTNHQFIDRLMKSAQGMFVNSSVADALPRPVDDSDRSGPTGCVPSSFDMEKVKTTIKQFFRDWSAEGAAERHQCYEPILSELKNLLPLATADERYAHCWL